MKQTVIFLLAIFMLSCNQKASTEKFERKSDTTKVQALYIDFSDSLKIKNGILWEIVNDVVVVDSNLKATIKKDTIFYYKVDTLWGITKRPAVSTERDVDSAIIQLRNTVVEIKSKDSLKSKKQ